MPSVSSPNYGLITDMANGIREGMITYQTLSNMKHQQQLQEMMSGITRDPNGNMVYTPEKQAMMNAQLQDAQGKAQQSQPMKASLRGLVGNVTGHQVPDDITGQEYKNYVEPLETTNIKGQYQLESGQARSANQTDTRTQRVHQNALNEIEKDQTTKNLLSTYQNLSNAESNFEKGGMTPQEFNELQQAVRSNLGIKGTGGVDERQETYLKSLGISADKVKQFLTGDPQDVSKSDPEFVKQIEKIVDLEKQNKRTQAQGLLDAKAKGHAAFYKQHPDEGADYENTRQGYLSQFNDASQQQAPAQQLSPQDQAAIAWAKANSKDPRAIQILKLHGM